MLRRTSSTPELNFHKDKNSLKVDVKVEYSLDLKFENILHSRYEIVEEESPTIIIVSSEGYKIAKKTRFLDFEDDDEFSSEVSFDIMYHPKTLTLTSFLKGPS